MNSKFVYYFGCSNCKSKTSASVESIMMTFTMNIDDIIVSTSDISRCALCVINRSKTLHSTLWICYFFFYISLFSNSFTDNWTNRFCYYWSIRRQRKLRLPKRKYIWNSANVKAFNREKAQRYFDYFGTVNLYIFFVVIFYLLLTLLSIVLFAGQIVVCTLYVIEFVGLFECFNLIIYFLLMKTLFLAYVCKQYMAR